MDMCKFTFAIKYKYETSIGKLMSEINYKGSIRQLRNIVDHAPAVCMRSTCLFSYYIGGW